MPRKKADKEEVGEPHVDSGRTSVTLRATAEIPGFLRTFSLKDHGENWEEEANAWQKRFKAEEV